MLDVLFPTSLLFRIGFLLFVLVLFAAFFDAFFSLSFFLSSSVVLLFFTPVLFPIAVLANHYNYLSFCCFLSFSEACCTYFLCEPIEFSLKTRHCFSTPLLVDDRNVKNSPWILTNDR